MHPRGAERKRWRRMLDANYAIHACRIEGPVWRTYTIARRLITVGVGSRRVIASLALGRSCGLEQKARERGNDRVVLQWTEQLWLGRDRQR